MTKGLEALERLIDNKVFISLGRIQGKKQFAYDINIIEKELQRLMVYDIQQEQTEKWLENANKKLKALEIIIYKRVDMFLLIHTFEEDYGREFYNYRCVGTYELSKEEYDLLKEVFYDLFRFKR